MRTYHLVDEFRGAPNRVNSVLREQGNPLRIGGEPIAATVITEAAQIRMSPSQMVAMPSSGTAWTSTNTEPSGLV